jgi:flavin reductase (DIM6/NTAB) family NADH-FMN oxidoreductase RutF
MLWRGRAKLHDSLLISTRKQNPMYFELSSLSGRNAYKLLTSTVVPRPIAWVVTLNADSSVNAAPFSFFNVMSGDPPLVAIGVGSRDNLPKDTGVNLIREDKSQFVINLVPSSLLQAMNITAIDFANGIDELKKANLTTAASHLIAPPRIAESPVAFECQTRQIVPLGNERYVVLADVLAVHIKDEAVLDAERCYVDTAALDLIGRMQAGAYSEQKNLISLPRLPVPDDAQDISTAL